MRVDPAAQLLNRLSPEKLFEISALFCRFETHRIETGAGRSRAESAGLKENSV
jgi:hypothetical protein